MTTGWIVVLIGGTWLAIGLGAAVVMGQRGHAPFTWGVLGTVLGPLAVVLAVDAVRHEVTDGGTAPARPRRRGGGVDVLVGIDGSPECEAALAEAVELFGPRLGRLVLASVVDFDAAAPGGPREARDRARHDLARAAALAGAKVGRVGQVTLAGKPAQVLADYARNGGFDLVVVGSRGAGGSVLLLGSVAGSLARGVGVPVLVFGDRRRAHRAAA